MVLSKLWLKDGLKMLWWAIKSTVFPDSGIV
jgi:hypothetical protein